eukprot:9466655-Pyramimonas_sp.AAC.2
MPIHFQTRRLSQDAGWAPDRSRVAPAARRRNSLSNTIPNWASWASARKCGVEPDNGAPCAADANTGPSTLNGAPEGRGNLSESQPRLAA